MRKTQKKTVIFSTLEIRPYSGELLIFSVIVYPFVGVPVSRNRRIGKSVVYKPQNSECNLTCGFQVLQSLQQFDVFACHLQITSRR
jgi:hypothetical protein